MSCCTPRPIPITQSLGSSQLEDPEFGHRGRPFRSVVGTTDRTAGRSIGAKRSCLPLGLPRWGFFPRSRRAGLRILRPSLVLIPPRQLGASLE